MPDGAPPSAPFFNRQALHLRPDPSRVVVRPFRPAVEPRDLHPVDKTRANHIVDRVLAMTADETDALLAETLRNFDEIGRAHVTTPVTNAQCVCHLLLANTNSTV